MIRNATVLHEHVSVVRLRANDFDRSRQLNNSVFLEVLEVGRWDWSLSNGIDLREDRLVGIVVRLELDFLKPVFWDPVKVLHVRTRAEQVERFSFYLRQTVEDMQGVVLADAKLRLALYDKEKCVPVAINLEELRKKKAACHQSL